MSEEKDKKNNIPDPDIVYSPIDPEDGIILEWWGRAEGLEDERQ